MRDLVSRDSVLGIIGSKWQCQYCDVYEDCVYHGGEHMCTDADSELAIRQAVMALRGQRLTEASRHGNWIRIPRGGAGPNELVNLQCSECGDKIGWYVYNRMPNFCSECGADMRGTKE